MNLDSVAGEVVELKSLRTAAPHVHVNTYLEDLEEDDTGNGSGTSCLKFAIKLETDAFVITNMNVFVISACPHPFASAPLAPFAW